jgi:hypothetical protein
MSRLTIEIGDTVESRGFNKGGIGVCIDIHVRYGTYRISWDVCNASWCSFNDLTLIKKGKKEMKEFTKSDLKTGMFVKQRDGMFMLVLEKAAVGSTCFTNLVDLKENLLAVNYTHLDIVAVYKAVYGGIVNEYMLGNELALIWERTEQTEAQKEMGVLQEQAKALQEQITKLQSKL